MRKFRCAYLQRMLSSQTPKQITDRLVQSFSSSFAVEKALKWEGSDGIGLDLGIEFPVYAFQPN